MSEQERKDISAATREADALAAEAHARMHTASAVDIKALAYPSNQRKIADEFIDWHERQALTFDRLAELSRGVVELERALAEYDAATGRYPNQRRSSRVIAAARKLVGGGA